jgi:hypothetical protein
MLAFPAAKNTSSSILVHELPLMGAGAITIRASIEMEIANITGFIIKWRTHAVNCGRSAQFAKAATGITNAVVTIIFVASIGFVQTWLFVEKVMFLLGLVSVLAVVSLPLEPLAIWIEALERILLRVVIALRLETFRTGKVTQARWIMIVGAVFFAMFFVLEGIAISDRTHFVAELTIESIVALDSERIRIVFWLLYIILECAHVIVTGLTGDDLQARTFACLIVALSIGFTDALICEISCLGMATTSLAPLVGMFLFDSCTVTLLLFMFHRSDCRAYKWIEDAEEGPLMDIHVEVTSEDEKE